MKQAFSKILSILLAIVVLFSTMSFTIDKHYCGKILVDVAINKAAKKCAMELYLESSGSSITKPSCCKDEHQVIIGQDELKTKVQLELDNPLAYTGTIQFQQHSLFPALKVLHAYSGNHDPPDRKFSFQAHYACYLI